ncbi:MAG: GNAT family N-acetyltransferase [Hyphomonadaceae bacterium]|jgi:predicted GNAT family acetyltransferase|uniref:GNAT family N-acetyltransferase n=1 Tax=Aquidulcibacter sp. TaxID=2052990 RepID=UPI0022C23DA2|nr:GNAT family N-acetyltransferase [Aquidulcibacter sp.]MCE2890302.1 N-acetyltransferase [Hyphomonadaceae bacterium]MCZ8208635.1 GNAT family N-acetyltransferase [Aquidulcibacter sp.]
MAELSKPAFEDLGAGCARLTLVRDSASGPKLCEITWHHRSDGARVLDHTFVPSALNGQGLAAILTEAALALAREDHVRIVPQCSYVARWIDRHPAWQNLVAS